MCMHTSVENILNRAQTKINLTKFSHYRAIWIGRKFPLSKNSRYTVLYSCFYNTGCLKWTKNLSCICSKQMPWLHYEHMKQGGLHSRSNTRVESCRKAVMCYVCSFIGPLRNHMRLCYLPLLTDIIIYGLFKLNGLPFILFSSSNFQSNITITPRHLHVRTTPHLYIRIH